MTTHSTTLESTPLRAIDFPLWGSRLIEASAGTGKTWTIAALYLRLVLGHGGDNAFPQPLRPADILVMTFTRAATRELSDRIRARLIEAAQCFRGERAVPAQDEFLADLLAVYPEGIERRSAAWRLAMAAEGMDDAAVHTIDAWCQRMLREHAFDSGCLFDEELSPDENAVHTEAAQDYWRQQCYPLRGEALDAVLKVWGTVGALIKDMHKLSEETLPPESGAGTLAECMEQHAQAHRDTIAALKVGWAARAQAMQGWLDAQTAPDPCDWKRASLTKKNYTGWLTTLATWASSADKLTLVLSDTAKERFTPKGLLKVRLPDAPAITLPSDFQAFADLLAALNALPDPATALRLHAAAHVQARRVELKQYAGTFGFQDMLERLDQALAGPNGERLRARMVAQHPVALIDEFQDTSPLQYRLFEQLYRTADNDPSTALLLIGDPKQSIYGFRGADIYSYLSARRATAGRHYVLDTNYRSTQALVNAVNHSFALAEARTGAGAFRFRSDAAPADNPLPFVAVAASGRPEQFQTTNGPVAALTLTHDLELRSGEEHRRLFAALCAERISTWLNDDQAGFAEPTKPLQRLRPADIAVLVRTGKEAQAVRRELRRRGVASVYLSDKDSVFDSGEAQDLLHWLNAVAEPLDVRRVRAGLATRMVGLTLDELLQLATDDDALDVRSEQLRALHHVWQTQGVLTMLRQTLHQLDLPARWLQEPDGERRLTNFLHLAELLQVASAQLEGEQALIRWLGQQLQGERAGSDEQIVRLESDADLVKVVTIHKSKGLEYPVVCLPFATSYRAVTRRFTSFLNLADDSGQRYLHLTLSDEAIAQADLERQREDLRLLYVALTRARHALWLGFGALKVGNGKDCTTHHSAAGYWLGGAQPYSAGGWLGPLQALAEGRKDIALYAAQHGLPRNVALTTLAPRATPAPLPEQPIYSAEFERRWGIGSFSQLVRGVGQSVASQSAAALQRSGDDERALDVPAAVLPARAAVSASTAVWHPFKRGPVIGNFLHDQLEWLAGEKFALAADTPLAERLRRRCERGGYSAEADSVIEWLSAVVSTLLPSLGVPLNALQHVLPEMEFWLPTGQLPASKVDALCCQHLLLGQERAALPDRTLHGMLMGFADLVFEHEGRYWVLDYKSNQLGTDGAAYHLEALAQAMAAHRYDVQAALYLLALHRLLRQRLGEAYDPAQHLGGAIYLFLRGIDGPESGVFTVAPPLALLDDLDQLLAS